jgi:outer membrane protein TolC
MKKKLRLLALSLLIVGASFGQSILEEYIQVGLSRNQSIQQQQFALEKSIYALKEAKALFLPNVSLMADYFLAGGGRTVDFPAGDLLNPVYGSLNELTNGNRFPQLENQNILLNPNNFYDAKFRTTVPLLNSEIEYNKKIKLEQLSLQEVEVELYQRELAKEIKIAYFKYLQSVEAIEIYAVALGLAKESKRINEALFRNDKVNRTVVLRAENEIRKFETLGEQARQDSNSARAYFNFLLNRDLAEAILLDSSYTAVAVAEGDSSRVREREELRKIAISGNINQHLIGLAQSHLVPKVSAFLDLGSQGFDWQVDNKTAYYFFGVSLQWDLFGAGKNKHKIKQAQLDSKIIQSQAEYVQSQLQLQFATASNNFRASLYAHQSAVSAFHTSQKYYADVLRLYKEGQALFIELLDAQNQLIQSELQANIALYDTYIKAAEVERATATFNLNK